MTPRPSLLVGFHRIDLTPPRSKRDTTPILGFSWERAKRWDAVHDPLFARAVFVDGGDGEVAIVSVDMIGDAIGFGDAARARIAHELGLAEERVMVACVHAHTTPETIGLSGFEPDAEWVDSVVNNIVRVVAEARSRAQPATLKTAAAELGGITCNRRLGVLQSYESDKPGSLSASGRARAGDLDTELRAVWAEDGAGLVLGAVVNFACHPVALQTLPLLSADIPGYAMAQMEHALGPNAVCLFLNAADGDVNPVGERFFEGLMSAGERIAGTALDVVRSPKADVIEPAVTSGRRIRTSLARKPTRPIEELLAERARLERDESPGNDTRMFLLQDEIELARKPEEVPVEVQVIQIGTWRVAGVPGELLCCLGRDIKQAAAGQPTMVASYANGYVGYICPEIAFKLGGYEVGPGRWSLLAEGGGERIRDAAIELMAL